MGQRNSISCFTDKENLNVAERRLTQHIQLTSFAQISASPKLRICWGTLSAMLAVALKRFKTENGIK